MTTGTTIALGIMAAVIAALASIVVALIAARTNRQATAVAWAETLVERLAAVEDKVTKLEAALSKSQRALQAAIRFIDRLVEWGRGGGKTVMPKPPKTLHEYLDADTWGSDETPHADDLEPTTGGGAGAAG